MGVINIPKTSTIRVLHYFGVGTNPIGGSSPITKKILSLVGNVSSDNPHQAMVLPREVFRKNSIRVPHQNDFEPKLIHTQSFPPFFNENFTHEGIILKIIPISDFLVYNGFDADLDAINIYRCIKNPYNLAKPAIRALLTFLRGCMTSILVNDTVTFIPSSVFMKSTPPSACKLWLNKLNITFPTVFTPHQEPVPASDPPVASRDNNLNLFQHFLSSLKLPGLSHLPAITNGPA